MERSRLRRVAVFLYLWLMIGFATGTLVLLGPSRWLTGGVRRAGWGAGTEDVLMIALIVAFVAGSFALSLWIFHRMRGTRTRAVRMGAPFLATLAAITALWGWMTPGTWADPDAVMGRAESAAGARFVFGPYPDEERLRELEAEGYTAVVSLLHPAVVPFEPKLLAEEREAVERTGLAFIHAPMLPWVSENEESLEQIRLLAQGSRGRYYVHCYLGRDRTNVVKRVVEESGVRVAGGEGLREARTLAERVVPFERGRVRELEPGLWLIPYPNEHELFGYLLFGSVGHVFSLLDPRDPGQRTWHEEMSRLLDVYAVPHTHRPLAAGDPVAARRLIDEARAAGEPVVLVVPFTEGGPVTGLLAPATAVLAAHRAATDTSAAAGSEPGDGVGSRSRRAQDGR